MGFEFAFQQAKTMLSDSLSINALSLRRRFRHLVALGQGLELGRVLVVVGSCRLLLRAEPGFPHGQPQQLRFGQICLLENKVAQVLGWDIRPKTFPASHHRAELLGTVASFAAIRAFAYAQTLRVVQLMVALAFAAAVLVRFRAAHGCLAVCDRPGLFGRETKHFRIV